MASPDPDVDYLLELLAPLGAATAHRMFGGWGMYLDGVMIGLVMRGAAYLKADALTVDAFTAAGSVPFVFQLKDRTVSTSYWSLPEASLDSSDAIRPWVQRALDAARRKAPARSRRLKTAR